MTTRFLLFAVAAFSWIGWSGADGRTWTDSTGQLQVEAEFVSSQPGMVWVLRTDGEVFGVPLDGLSKGDQEYVLQQLRRKQAEAEKHTPAPGQPPSIPYGPARKLGNLANQRIEESSGLAPSRRHPGWFWTHNDSGGEPRIYLFDSKGRDLGSYLLAGIRAYDWEDVASFESEGKDYLLLCDVGNNGRAAGVQILHLVEEPALDPKRGLESRPLPVAQTIYFSYQDDHRDCEAVAVDPTDKTILFVSKERGMECYAYALGWPKDDPDSKSAVVARLIATLKIPPATAMDVSPDGRRAVVLSYGNAYEYTRIANEDWGKAFSRPPREITMPVRVQGESICYGPDGKTLYLTSEKLPTPLWEIRAEETSTDVPADGDRAQ